jgi:hypothetical protein
MVCPYDQVNMTDKSRGMFGSLYSLVKAFLKDFYTESKKGTLQHRKGIAIFAAFVLVCFLVVAVLLLKVSESPVFCGVCHNMKVYVDSWKSSTHREVACIKCHYKPGFANHLKGKWQDGQLSLVYFVTGKSPTRPHAEIDDVSCLQSGCHKRTDLKNEMVFKNVLFSHPRHIEQMKRQKQLRCTTCHSQIVQGAHMTVTDVECFICHFYKTRDQKTYVTGCNTCHFEARGDIKVSEAFTFNHKRYIARGIKCEQCHTTVVSGDGHIPEFACLQCHNKRAILEAKYTPEFLHQNHVTKHKVECFTCHSPIKHQITGLHYKGQEAAPCADCHNGGLHLEKVSMYLGKGAKLVEDRPNRMAAINMDCDVCHGQGRKGKGPAATCDECHGNLTNGMMERWRKNLRDGQDDLLKEISAAKAAGGEKPTGAVKQALSDAQYNYEFIKRGDGVHNIVYAMQIVETTKKALQVATGKAKGPVEKTGPVSCMKTCHGEIGERRVSFGSVLFPHAAHIDGEASCFNCHSQYAQHGQTYIKGCSNCHHGEGMGKVRCSDCHRPEESMFSGKGVRSIANMPDAMYGKVACTECHSVVKQGKKGSNQSVKANCVACHSKDYAGLVDDWKAQDRKLQDKYAGSLSTLEKEIGDIEKQEGRHSVPLRAGLDEIAGDTQFLLKGKVYHNPQYAEAIAAKIEKNTSTLQSMIKTKKEGRKLVLQK